MKFEHFVEACKYNDIDLKIKLNNKDEKAAILEINEDAYIVTFSDDEIITSIQFISTCIPTQTKNIDNIIGHTANMLLIISKLIKIFDSVNNEDIHDILNNLGFFNTNLKEKKNYNTTNCKYLVSTESGLLFFTISKTINN